MMKIITKIISFSILLGHTCLSYAQSSEPTQQDSTQASEDSSFHWEADLGLLASYRKNLIPDVFEKDEEIGAAIVLSGGVYYDNFFIEASPFSGRPFTIGYSLYRDESQQVNLVAESLFFSLSEDDQERGNMLDGINEREDSTEVGIEYFAIFKKYDVRLNVLHDAMNEHNGTVASVAISRPFFTKYFMFVPGLTLSYIDDNAADYYYGVSAQEATDFRPEYKAKGSLVTSARVYLERPINESWSIIASGGYVVVSSGISDSPIVQGRTDSYSLNVGVLWTF